MRWDFFIFIFSLLAIMVTDTAFRKSSLRKIFFEKNFPGTSKNWPYHTGLLVFCFKVKLSPVREYLNYYYNISNDWAIPEKSKQRGFRTYLFLKKYGSGSFRFVTSPLKILDKKAFFTLGNSVKLCYTPWKCQGQKPRQSFTLGNSVKLCNTLWSFLEIALLFQLTSRISTWYFSHYPRRFHVLNPPPCLDFSLSLFLSLLLKRWQEGRANHPRIKLWYRGEEVLMKKVFYLTHKENQGRKPRKY